MSVKVKYKKDINALQATGVFDETSSLGTNVKGKIKNSNGDFIGLGWEEEDDILEGTNLPSTGSFGGYYNRYTQANIAVVTARGTGKDGNNYGYVIKRAPDISNSGTWGGVSLYPPSNLQRISGDRYRFSFDYRGYSGGHTMNVYQNYTIGWGSLGVSLPTPWSYNISSFDTDWEWRHSSYEFTVTDALLNEVAGHYDWNATTQYGTGWYGIRYNGDLYRHRNGRPAPTLGENPATTWANEGSAGPYDARYVGGASAGHFNVYRNIKIGFSYQAQNSRGTHVHVDNIHLTNITKNDTFKYDVSSGLWLSENLHDSGLDVLIKGTAYVALGRSDNSSLDRFAVEGNREFSINGTATTPATGRGLTLITFNLSGTVSTNTRYDVHGSTTDIQSLATALSNIGSSTYWALMSFDAIGSASTHNGTSNLRNQLVSMGSRMWNPNDPEYLWTTNAADVRNPYAAVGLGQNLLKEDGSGATDGTYKRKGVVQVRV